MENLDLPFVTIRLKRICSKRVIRLTATLSNKSITEENTRILETWLDKFYRHVDKTNTQFCVIIVVDTTIDDAETLQRLCALLGSERNITKRLSVTTCIVAPSFLSFAAQMAMHVYSVEGIVHFPATLEEAKDTCLDEANSSIVPKRE